MTPATTESRPGQIEVPPLAVEPGDTCWLTDRTGPWKVMGLRGDEALLVVVGSTTTAWVRRADIGRVRPAS